MLTEMQTVRRKILLKNQAIKLLRKEKDGLRERLLLLDLKASYERQMSEQTDPALSAKIDCITFLLDEA